MILLAHFIGISKFAANYPAFSQESSENKRCLMHRTMREQDEKEKTVG